MQTVDSGTGGDSETVDSVELVGQGKRDDTRARCRMSELRCPLCGGGITHFGFCHSDGDWAESGLSRQECIGCGMPWKFWDMLARQKDINEQLLVACKTVVAYWDDCRPVDLFQDSQFQLQIRAAITKAEEERAE